MKFEEHYISSKPWSWVLGVTALTLVLIGTLVTPAAASWYGHPDTGMAFVPEGDLAFADRVVSFMPQFDGTGPSAAFLDSNDALGPTNYTGLHGTPGHYYYNTGEFVSLGTDGAGTGGVLILEFTDNYLMLNGNSTPDIFVFEVGAIVEVVDVEVSEDGLPGNWSNVGSIQPIAGKNIRTVDLDAFAGTYGWDLTNKFYFIRLTDDGSPQGGAWSGADIDAVAGIPEPGSFILVAFGALAAVIRRRRL